MAKQPGEAQRDRLVYELALNEEEQRLCWALLDGYRLAVAKNEEHAIRLFEEAVRLRVEWLRTDSGQQLQEPL